MSVRVKNEVLIIQNATTGNIIDTIDMQTYTLDAVSIMIKDILNQVVYKDYHDLLIKKGYKS